MAVQTRSMTIEEFEQFTQSPENEDRLFEYIGGEIVEVPSSAYTSKIASRISGFIFIYLLQHDIGHLTGEAGGYRVSGEDYAPDVAFISKQKQPELAQRGYNPNPPDLAVEVLSPTDKPSRIRTKIAGYLAAGTILWLVDPEAKVVEVYTPGQKSKMLRMNDSLDGEDVLPGFTLAVKDIFQP
jgi:Uma2 family endonuclease